MGHSLWGTGCGAQPEGHGVQVGVTHGDRGPRTVISNRRTREIPPNNVGRLNMVQYQSVRQGFRVGKTRDKLLQ